MVREDIQHGDAGQKRRFTQDDWKFHHATQSDMQFKTYEKFLSGISNLIFLDSG